MRHLDYVPQNGVSHDINFDAHHRVKGWPGIAVCLLGWKAEYEAVTCFVLDEDGGEVQVESGEFDTVPSSDTVIAVMVGDDRHHAVDVSDLIPLADDAFCRSCGQIGCGCNVYA